MRVEVSRYMRLVSASRIYRDLHVTLLGSRMAQAPWGRLRGGREELVGTGRQ